MNTVGDRIKELRSEHKLTQDKFGEKIGLKKAGVSLLEKNERGITDAVLKNLIMEFCVNESWLKEGIGDKYNDEKLHKKEMLESELIENALFLNGELTDLFNNMKKFDMDTQIELERSLIGLASILNKPISKDIQFEYFENVSGLIFELERLISKSKEIYDLDNIVLIRESIPEYLNSLKKSVIDTLNLLFPKLDYKDINTLVYKQSKGRVHRLAKTYTIDLYRGLSVGSDNKNTHSLWMTPGPGKTENSMHFFNKLPTTSDEQYLLEGYRNLSDLDKHDIKTYIDIKSKITNSIKTHNEEVATNEQNNYSYIRRISEEKTSYVTVPTLGKVAAGPPIEAVSNYGDMVPIPSDKAADFALVVKGKSMEPEFPENSLVFVKHQEDLENGEIGIISINGEVTCKKFYKHNSHIELISINPNYNPMVYDQSSDIKIIGKVIR